jgi:hypothetical protein
MSKSETPAPTRRRMFAGAATAGAAAAAVTLLPRGPATPATGPKATQAPEAGGGYQVTDHVLRYYRTTRV